MAVSEIPLSPENQAFSISLAGQSFQMAITWRAAFWCLDIMDSTGADLIKGIPLITGADLLAQYRFLGTGFRSMSVVITRRMTTPPKAILELTAIFTR